MTEQEQYPDRRFVIFNTSELPNIDFNQVYETDADTVRKSVDETKTFVKYDLPEPSSVLALTTKSQEYTYDEILVVLSTEEWTQPMPLPPA
tara:strand:- start:93 stop:365 length:273 start_codon:yes stop_codon:yes gene_type:complete